MECLKLYKVKQPELFRSRLQKLIANTRKGVMYGE